MSRGDTLVKNTIIYAIGNFGSKILSFLIVPLYSYYINTSDMGTYDLIVTTIMLIAPVVTMQMSDGVYRWLIDGKNDAEQVILSASQIIYRNLLIFSSIYVVVCCFFAIPYHVGTWLYACTNMLYGYYQQIIRGLGKTNTYSYTGVLYTIISLSGNVIGLILLHLGADSLLYSSSIACIICLIIFFHCLKQYHLLSLKAQKTLKRDMLIYSLPLIPNVICWWIVNSLDRYTILYFIGKDANGIFSISSKYPAMVTTITTVFYLAWQESAIKEYDSPGRDEFFSSIFEKYYKLLFCTVLICIPAIKIFTVLFMESSYKISWEYTGFLFIGTAFSALCSFLGIAYNISKKTKMALITTLVAAIVDVGVNLVFMGKFGLQIASISTFVAYIVLFIVRFVDTKKYFLLNVRWGLFSALTVLVLGMLFVTFSSSLKLCLIETIAACALWIAVNKNLVIRVIQPVKEKFRKK